MCVVKTFDSKQSKVLIFETGINNLGLDIVCHIVSMTAIIAITISVYAAYDSRNNRSL